MHFFSASKNVKLFYTRAIVSKTRLRSTLCYYLLFHKKDTVDFIYGAEITSAENRCSHLRAARKLLSFYCFILPQLILLSYPNRNPGGNTAFLPLDFLLHILMFLCHRAFPYFYRWKTLDPGLNATKPQAGRKTPSFNLPFIPSSQREGRLGYCFRKSQ